MERGETDWRVCLEIYGVALAMALCSSITPLAAAMLSTPTDIDGEKVEQCVVTYLIKRP